MSICITHAGESLFSSLQAQGLPLVIDTMIFANVPGLNPGQAADRAQAVPTAHIVHNAVIPLEFRSFVNPNQVVYSVLLGSDVGDFTFNWQGLYCSAHQTLIAVAELPSIAKRANDAGTNTPGNNLTRNFMLQFTGAQALTGLTVEAEVWQLDFTVRLKGIDERERLSNRDIYGRAAFLDDGWLLAKDAGGYHFEPGTGYVEGIRAALASQTPAVPTPLPCDVYLDARLELQGSDVVTLVTPRFVAQGVALPDYTEAAPFHTPHYCVQVAHVAADGSVTDLRPKAPSLLEPLVTRINDFFAPHVDTIWLGAGAMVPSKTNGATAATGQTTSYLLTEDYLDYSASVDQAAEIAMQLPANWDRGTVQVKLHWRPAAAGATAGQYVGWRISGGAVGDSDTVDRALGAVVTVADQALAGLAGVEHVTPASAAITIGGTPQAGDRLHLKIARDADYAGGGTAMPVMARLLGIELQYGVSGTVAAWG